MCHAYYPRGFRAEVVSGGAIREGNPKATSHKSLYVAQYSGSNLIGNLLPGLLLGRLTLAKTRFPILGNLSSIDYTV